MTVGLKGVVEKVRSDAQQLHSMIDAAAGTERTQARITLERAGVKAQQLADALKVILESQRTVTRHLNDAIENLEDVGKLAKEMAATSDSEVRARNRAMLEKTRAALSHLSRAIAVQRLKGEPNG
jgi:hypothetical protein